MIEIKEVMINSKIVKCGSEVILFGVPPEVIKSIRAKQLPDPTAIVIPDCLIIDNSFQNSTEFLLYYYLFISQVFFKTKKKLKILGSKKSLDNNQKLLSLCLFGLEEHEYLNLGLDASLAQIFVKERNYFSIKKKDNEIYKISDYIENYPFDIFQRIDLGSIKIQHLNFNRYEIFYKNEKIVCDLTSTEKQKPPYEVPITYNSSPLMQFSIQALGGSSGFSPNHSSAGLLLSYNGSYILIDAIPYLDEHLVALGIAKSQISVIFLSHIHDDHCNLVTFIFSSKKVKIMATFEIFWMAMYKLSLMLNVNLEEVFNYFDFIPLEVGKTLNYYGIYIRPHYTIHTIPTIGAKFSVYDYNHKEYSIIVTSDNQSLKEARIMLEKGVISEARYIEIESIYLEKTNILFADAGEGTIHGEPRDTLKSQAERVVFYNLDSLSEEFSARYSIANTGKIYSLLEAHNDILIAKALEFFMDRFKNFDSIWLNIFSANMRIVNYNKDDVILIQGTEATNSIYLIITGYCHVIYNDEGIYKVIATKEAGDLFGEMSIIQKINYRNASIIAASSVKLCCLDGKIFDVFIFQEKKKEYFVKYWNICKLLANIKFFKNLSTPIQEELARNFHYLFYEKTDNLNFKKKIGIFIILEGKLSYKQKDFIYDFEFGDYILFPDSFQLSLFCNFNENSLLEEVNLIDEYNNKDFLLEEESSKNAEKGIFIVDQNLSVLCIYENVFQDILKRLPGFLFYLNHRNHLFTYTRKFDN